MKRRGSDRNSRLHPGRWRLPAWLPIPLLLITMAVLWVADLRVV